MYCTACYSSTWLRTTGHAFAASCTSVLSEQSISLEVSDWLKGWARGPEACKLDANEFAHELKQKNISLPGLTHSFIDIADRSAIEFLFQFKAFFAKYHSAENLVPSLTMHVLAEPSMAGLEPNNTSTGLPMNELISLWNDNSPELNVVQVVELVEPCS